MGVCGGGGEQGVPGIAMGDPICCWGEEDAGDGSEKLPAEKLERC